MNFIFFCQSTSLDVFYQTCLRLKSQVNVGKVGFYIANLRHYEKFLQQNPTFEEEYEVVKEWEIHEEADGKTPDVSRIRQFEKEVGDPTLWGPVVTDRRLYLGKRITYRQDYKPRFTHDQILAVLDIALQKVNELFNSVQPDAIFTIYTATFGDCLGHMFAKSRNVISLDVRMTRIKNYIMAVNGVVDPPPHLRDIQRELAQEGIPEDLRLEAEEHLQAVVKKQAMYDGVPVTTSKQEVAQSNQTPTSAESSGSRNPIVLLKKLRKYRKPPYSYDLQSVSVIASRVFKDYLNPRLFKKAKSRLEDVVIRKSELSSLDYVLYPLHTEPELVLSQFARPYLNQIEAIRNIGLSLPVGMTLLVKEHPVMYGRRSIGYYHKLLEIPNVRLAGFDMSSEEALQYAKLVTIIRGAIGLEAIIKRIPVISLGKSLYDLLPTSMIRRVDNLYDLPKALNHMLANYEYSHEELVLHIATLMKGSIGINLISDLLRKTGRYRSGGGKQYPFESHPHLDSLAAYLLTRVRESQGITENVE